MDFWAVAEPQGTEDRQLWRNACQALVHWHDRSAAPPGVRSLKDDYDSVPFEPVRTVRVTYKHIGELRPLPYHLNE